MPDEKPTHLPAEGEGTPQLPANTDLGPKEHPTAEPKPATTEGERIDDASVVVPYPTPDP